MKATIHIPYIVIPSLSSLALKSGLNPGQIFAEAGVDLAQAQLHKTDLTLDQVEHINRLIAQKADLPHYGLLMGEHVQAEMLGVFGPLIASCPTTRVAIKNFSRYKRLLHPMYDLTLEASEQGTRIVYASHDELPIGNDPVYAETLFAALVNLGGIFLGKRMHPIQMEFRHPQPSYVEEYERIFQCPLYFDQERDCMLIKPSVLDQPMLSHSFNVYQMLKQQAQRSLAEEPREVVEQVNQLIRQQLNNPELTAELIATQLNVSPRTLQRQLARESTSFKTLKESIRLELAERLLSQTGLSTEVIALELGYRDRSNFVHAFKRLAGCSPSDYRAKHNAAH